MDRFKYLTNVSTLTFDVDACVGCGICTMVCPHGIFRLADGKAQVLDKDGCMECGACATNCPTQAVSVSPGVGCAAYIIQTWIKGKEQAGCDDVCCC
jgi:NAD-dependent dihydropyrimidine dehydrogenase PreA subunit